VRISKKNLISFSFLILISFVVIAQKREPEVTMIKGEPMYSVLKPGDIPAIFEPEFISISEAENYYYDEEPLLMVVDGDESKAYSTWHLDRHEIVNDQINGKAITVTW
jgi:hypothetical protein